MAANGKAAAQGERVVEVSRTLSNRPGKHFWRYVLDQCDAAVTIAT